MPMNDPYKIGLKLYSTNTDLIGEALTLRDEYFDYVELYIVPGSYDGTIQSWKEFNVPYVIHAPHSFHGVNLAKFESRAKNMKHISEVQRFADYLAADIIIAHGGNNGSINETIEQLRIIQDERIVVENKPKIGLTDELCVGWSPAEFNHFREAFVLNGFVLDFTHAVCAARTAEMDEWNFITAFFEFRPKIFHISDIDSTSHKDVHLNLGQGSLDLKRILSMIPANGFVTIETPRKLVGTLDEYVKDIIYLEGLFRQND